MGEEWWCQCSVPASAVAQGWEGKKHQLLHVRSSFRTWHPWGHWAGAAVSKQQEEKEGEEFWPDPSLGLCPKPNPCCHRAKALPGLHLYCWKLSWVVGWDGAPQPQPLLGEAIGQGLLGLLALLGGIQTRVPSPGPRHKVVATPDFISEEAAPCFPLLPKLNT